MKNVSHGSYFLCFHLQGLKPLKSQGIYEKVLAFLQQDQSSRIVLNSLECSYTLCLLGEFIGLVQNSLVHADVAWEQQQQQQAITNFSVKKIKGLQQNWNLLPLR